MPFYHKKILSDPASTIALLSSDGKEIATAPLTDSLSVSVGVTWNAGGGLIDAFQQGIAKGANKALNVAREAQNVGANLGNRVGGNFNGAEQGILVTAGDYYKKYGGSQTNFNLPPLSFLFINEDDTTTVIDKAKELVNYLVPKVTKSSNADYRYELPPNNFQTPNQGFDPSNMTGWFGVRIGSNRKINYFVPDNVSIKYSPEVSLVDNSIPMSIEVTVNLVPAYKFMGPDVVSVMG